MAGFQINGIYSNNNTDSNNPATTQTISNNEALGLGINYVWQKLNVDLAMTSSKQETFLGTTATAAALPAVSTSQGVINNVMGTNIGILTNYAGATYDFGILKAYAQYINTKYTSNLNSNVYLQRSAQQIGVRGNWTPKIQSWGSVGNGSYTGPNAVAVGTSQASGKADFTGYQLGTNYILSKRTNLYAIFGSTQSSTNGAITAEGASSYGVGMRHTF
jgi:hypothetical protein